MENFDIKEIAKITKTMDILYVEDEEDLQDKNVNLLGNLFRSVTPASNGVEALELYENTTYDIVMSDINMPKMNGIDLCQTILSKNPKQQIIITSAYNDSENLQVLMDLGISHFISKPMDFKRVISIIGKTVLSIEEEKNNANKNLIDDTTGFKNLVALHRDIESFKDMNLLLISLKNFSSLQTIYGIDEADKILNEFTSNLGDFLENKDFLYRKGSSKIAYLFNQTTKIDDFITKLINFLNESKFDTVLGISTQTDNLIVTANMALDFSLEHGLKYKIYSKHIDLTEKYKNTEYFKSVIINALKNGLVYPVFQPIFDKDKNILKYEVLMRVSNIVDDVEHVYYPGQFLSVAMGTDKYIDMSILLIEKAFKLMKNSDKMFSINLSYNDIFNEILINEIENHLIINYGMGERFVIELLETQNVSDYGVVEKFINRFHPYGVKIALDDFGAGYSNLNHIINFHCDYVKLDGALIKNITTDKKSLAIVRAVVSFCKELNIKTIAEYVASAEIFEVVKELEIDEFQGFYLAQPNKEILQ